MTNQELLARAGQDLINKGMAVTVCHGKRPLVKDWQRSRLDLNDLVMWCGSDYVTGLAIVTGQLSQNAVCLDFDGRDWRSAFEHFSYVLDLGSSPKVQTGSGRRHIYLRCPDLPERHTVAKFVRNGATVELRANRAANVCPPSRHPSGDFYRWLDQDSDMAERPYFDLFECLDTWGKVEHDKPRDIAGQAIQTTWSDPDQTCANSERGSWSEQISAGQMRQRFKPRVQQLHPSQTYGRLPRSALEFLAIAGPIQAGDRNNRLYRASQQFCAAGYSLEDGLNILVPSAIRSGLEPDEITNTIKSAYNGASNFEPIGGK